MFGLQVDKTLTSSLTQQLTTQIRNRILHGAITGGEKLPPSRDLAQELNVARNVIIQVYEQLIAEGYLESRVGSGTFVTDLRDYPFNSPARRPDFRPNEATPLQRREDIIEFYPGNPDGTHFPRLHWARILKEICSEAPNAAFEYGPVEGEWLLRSALVQYLFRTKGIVCHPEQVLISAGATQGIDLLAKTFRSDRDAVAIEDPSVSFIQETFRQNGFTLLPVPVDQQGMKTDALPQEQPFQLIYVVPSHQFPGGGVLPIGRRLQLLEYARAKKAYIIEDDYDSEFRYQGEPIQSLRHLDPDRVIYLGTFSKIFSPGLRLGYLIVPPHLRDEICRVKERLNLGAATLEQLAMARFIGSKMLDRHVYQMKKIYAQKRKHLIAALVLAFGDKVRIAGENAGMHVLLEFSDRQFQPGDLQRFGANGVEVDWVEDYAIRKGCHSEQLVLGYGNLSVEQITIGVARLKQAIGMLPE